MVAFVCHKMAAPRRLIYQYCATAYRYSTTSVPVNKVNQTSVKVLSPAPALFSARGLLGVETVNRCLHTTSVKNEIVQFHLSDIGEGIKEVTVKEW